MFPQGLCVLVIFSLPCLLTISQSIHTPNKQLCPGGASRAPGWICNCISWRPRNSSRLLGLGTAGIWGQILVCGGGCPGHWRVLNSTPGSYPLDVCL